MPNEKPPLNYFDSESFDDFIKGPEGRKNIDAYMDGMLNRFKTTIRDKFKTMAPTSAPTVPVDLDALMPLSRTQHDQPIWEAEKTGSNTRPAKEVHPETAYPSVPSERPSKPKHVVHTPDVPTEKGTVVTGNGQPKPQEDVATKAPEMDSPQDKPTVDPKLKGKKVNTDAIEKRYKDREEKLGDLFKNRGQIS